MSFSFLELFFSLRFDFFLAIGFDHLYYFLGARWADESHRDPGDGPVLQARLQGAEVAGGQRVVAEAGRAEREDPQGTGEKTIVGTS